MKLDTLLEGVALRERRADLSVEIRDIAQNSAAVQTGDVFVALRGVKTDGYRYIGQAVGAGAAVIVCEQPPELAVPYVLVDDARLALAGMAANYFGRPAEKLTLIGVTGTKGKTTVTTLLKQVLERTLGTKVGLIGTNQNMIGARVLPAERTTPEAYTLHRLFAEMAAEGCTHVVMEVSSVALDMRRVAGLRFAIGAFTNLSREHLDNHGTMERYLEAKCILFSQCDCAVVNLDDAAAGTVLARSTAPRALTFSVESDAADLVAKNIKLEPDRVKFEAVAAGEIARVELGLPGRFNVSNALAVLAVAQALGLGLRAAADTLKTADSPRGRLEVIPTGTPYTVLTDYAHTPDSLEQVLAAVRLFTRGRIILLFGCGGDRDRGKRPLMGGIAERGADVFIVTSDNSRSERTRDIIADILGGMSEPARATVIEDRREAIAYALAVAGEGDVVLLAGKGHETYQEAGGVTVHFDEREIVAELLEGGRP